VTPIFDLCNEYVVRAAALDPVSAGMRGLTGIAFGPATDYGPDGIAAHAELVATTLRRLATLSAASPADTLAASHLRERLESASARQAIGEPFRELQAQFGIVNRIHDSVDLLPRDTDDDWRNIIARLTAIPLMLASWQCGLEIGAQRRLLAARRQAIGAAEQAERYCGIHDNLARSYGDGPLAAELAGAVAAAHAGYAEVARYLRTEYAPRASEVDAVGAERYAVAARESLGADIDLVEAYQWGWAELERVETELTAEADRVRAGASVEEAIAVLNDTQYVSGVEAYQSWLQERHDRAIDQLNGTHFDIAEPLRTVAVTIAHGSTAGSPYYTQPSEDLSRPGRTWWPLGNRDRFAIWHELSTVFHEGVPGHHLQHGAVAMAGDRISRFAKTTTISGYGEGWALYAERLADELDWFTEPGTRLGMLARSAFRAARVVIDIGVHLDLPLPDGSRWNYETARAVLRDRGRTQPHRVEPEVVRYFGWPAQAISYKLGERAWLDARAEARRRPGFDLRRWHTAALDRGPIGLDGLRDVLRGIEFL